jgi:hypothetical protein
MVKLYYPPVALLPRGNQNFVELAGAKCILAMDDEKQFLIVSDIFSELSWGEFWKDVSINDQIEKITVKHEDSDAIYDSKILAERVITAINKIIDRKLLLFGVASFEGNAFETNVFDEVELDQEDSDRLMNLYKSSRLNNVFPNVQKQSYVEINYFGEASDNFTLPNKKGLNEIAAMIYPYKGYASGIVAVAQGAANFIILSNQTFQKFDENTEIQIDKNNLHQMFDLVKKGILAAPISWFKINYGIEGIETLDGWDEIKDLPEIQEVTKKYLNYIRKLITQKEKKTIEDILAEDIGTHIEIEELSEEQIQDDLECIMDALNILNEMEISNEAISLLYYPPKVLFASEEKSKSVIGGAMTILSIDVGKNIVCIEDLREDLTYTGQEENVDKEDMGTEIDFNKQKYFELENPTQLRDIYSKAFQKIIKNSQIFLGVLELEFNAFEFSLFQELEISEEYLDEIKNSHHGINEVDQFPKLQDEHIQMIWVGKGKEYFTNNDCEGSLDLAAKFNSNQQYLKGYATGIVCVDGESTYLFILANNFEDNWKKLDEDTLELLFENLKSSKMAPLCWFKISLGLESLTLHPYWKSAKQYTSLLRVMDNYKKYVDELIAIKAKEDQYKIYKM